MNSSHTRAETHAHISCSLSKGVSSQVKQGAHISPCFLAPCPYNCLLNIVSLLFLLFCKGLCGPSVPPSVHSRPQHLLADPPQWGGISKAGPETFSQAQPWLFGDPVSSYSLVLHNAGTTHSHNALWNYKIALNTLYSPVVPN